MIYTALNKLIWPRPFCISVPLSILHATTALGWKQKAINVYWLFIGEASFAI